VISPRVGDFSEITVWNQSNRKIIMGGGRFLTSLTVLTRLTALTADRIDRVDGVDSGD
jgi:hypothetical protein